MNEVEMIRSPQETQSSEGDTEKKMACTILFEKWYLKTRKNKIKKLKNKAMCRLQRK